MSVISTKLSVKMSQRIHSCINNTNLDTIQCETYTARLIQREKTKSTLPQKPTQLKANRDNAHAGSRSTVTSSRHMHRPTSAISKIEPHQGIYSDGYSDVLVKTHKPKITRPVSQMRPNDSWGKILRPQLSRENISSFTNFDPLRTIHFLTNELQHKLQQSVPDDIGVQHMIIELQQALSRIPPELSETSWDVNKEERISRRNLAEAPFESYRPLKETINKSCQTPKHIFVEPNTLHHHLEESSEKIENACKQMELLCTQLKSEKDELEALLQKERSALKDISKQSEEFKNKYNATCLLVQSLEMRNQEFESEIRKLTVQLESQQGPTSQELKIFIEELQKQKSNADDECLQLKQKLTIAHMENEKYQAVLDARDSQVKEIRNEMSQLQEVVNEQLMELQNNPFSSDTSSISNITASVSSICNNKQPPPDPRITPNNDNHLNRKRFPTELKDHNYGDYRTNHNENPTWNTKTHPDISKLKLVTTTNEPFKTCHNEVNKALKTKSHLKGKFTKVTNLALASCKSSTD